MPLRFGINGFGRIGRALLRIVLTREDLRSDLQPAAVNDIVPAAQLARLLARDTVQGPFALPVRLEGNALRVGDLRIPVFQEPDPARIDWGQAGTEVVVEATGRFLRRGLASGHLRRPPDTVRTVVLSANSDPSEPADATVCLGLNEGSWDPERQPVVSNASCTTNALALMAKVLHESFGVRRALMNTVHSYTENQRLIDMPHPDPRRSRAAALNIIPTSSTAARSAGLLGVTEDEPVSSDFVGDPRSVVVDLPLIQAVGSLVRVVGWYDNEWGYANRLADLLARIYRKTRGGSENHG